MNEMTQPRMDVASLKGIRRKAVTVTQESVVTLEPLREESPLPMVVRPALSGLDPIVWASGNRDFINRRLLQYGGLLFRGFGFTGEEDLERFITALAGDLLEYTYRSTPRTRVSGKIYTSTEYPADQSIPFHNEMSYATEWPRKIWFLCITPAEQGGETPIADSRKVLARIDPEIQRNFREKKVMYVRNYSGSLDLPWQNVFQTEDPREVEEFCRKAGIGFEWRGGDRLKTWQICQAVTTHPDTGEEVWFNQAHLFHISGLEPATRELLLATFGEDELPRNTYYGDGSPIEPVALEAIREAYQREEIVFQWQRGDLLMLDNILVAHARRPYAGTRKIVVGMAELTS